MGYVSLRQAFREVQGDGRRGAAEEGSLMGCAPSPFHVADRDRLSHQQSAFVIEAVRYVISQGRVAKKAEMSVYSLRNLRLCSVQPPGEPKRCTTCSRKLIQLMHTNQALRPVCVCGLHFRRQRYYVVDCASVGASSLVQTRHSTLRYHRCP